MSPPLISGVSRRKMLSVLGALSAVFWNAP